VAGFEKRLLFVWIALSVITGASVWIGSPDDQQALHPSGALTASAIGIAFFKVRIIFTEFMEVRHAPALLRRLADLWVGLSAAILIGAYFAGVALAQG